MAKQTINQGTPLFAYGKYFDPAAYHAANLIVQSGPVFILLKIKIA
jgi:hypothetical protein